MKTAVNFKMSNKLKQDLKIFAAKTNDSQADIMTMALTQFLERESNKNG